MADMTYDLSPGWAVLPWLAAALLALTWLRHRGGPAVARSRHVALWACRIGALALPNDADTQLAAALRQLAGRLGREAPAGVVVVSDGRVRDPDKLDEMANVWKRLKVPVHVVPVGRGAEGGDVAVVAAVAPA